MYFLPEGTISNSINLQLTKNSEGNFIVKNNQQNVFQILNGSGDFLNSSGFIVQNTYGDLQREMLVYFQK